MLSAIPTLETPRLRLRAHTPTDLPLSLRLWSNPVVTRHLGGRPFTEEEVWTRLLRYAGHWSWLGFGYWLVEERSTGHLVGEVGFADYKRELSPSFNGAPEIGWVLTPEMHGQGYATEAVRAALAWGTAHFGKDVRTVCLISPGNSASLRVAHKCGYVEYHRTTYKGEPVILFERSSAR